MKTPIASQYQKLVLHRPGKQPLEVFARRLKTQQLGQGHTAKLVNFAQAQAQKTGNREPGTGNREPGTGNREPGTGNREPND